MTASFGGMKGNRNNQRNDNVEKKQLAIKVKPKVKRQQESVDDHWVHLQAAIKAIHDKTAVATSLQELLQFVESACSRKHAELLYSQLTQVCDSHIHKELHQVAQKPVADSVAFLAHILAVWRQHYNQMVLIQKIFVYLDRTYVRATPDAQEIVDLGMTLFRQHLDSYPEVRRKTIAGILRQIETEREASSVDRTQIYELLKMLELLGLYKTSFEDQFMKETNDFYSAECAMKLRDLSTPDYLQHCTRRLAEEADRSLAFLSASTRRPLISCVETQLVGDHFATILGEGYADLVKQHRVADLARLYALADRVDRLAELRQCFAADIRTVGGALIMDPEKDSLMVESLLVMKSKLEEIWSDAFKRNESFATALKDAFEHFINQRSNKPAELVAKFVDAELRGASKGKTEESMEASLEKALMLFRHISGKDVFEAFYKKDLAKRLLLGRSASADAEKAMIAKLKAECGSQFTSHLEGMFKDIDLSKEFMLPFKQSNVAQRGLPTGVDMSVNVLTSGYWPSHVLIPATLPHELAQCSQVFSEFYLSKHSGRKLVWHNSLGTCIMKAHFRKGPKELAVSLFQCVVLMLFNESDGLSYRDILEQSGISDEVELKRTLQSLACGKTHRVLTKTPKGRDVDESDVFAFNYDFHASLYRVRINTIQLKETTEENTKTNEQVMQDRQYQIDAAIVRVMKTRKTLSHKLLMAELMQMLRFTVKQPDLKKRVESLIDREYLERDVNNPSVYNYLA